MRKILIAALLILLGGCFMSATPVIPARELASPHGLAGQHWWISTSEGISASRVRIRQPSPVHFVLTGMDGDGEDSLFRLVALDQAGTYLFIGDEDKNRSTYYLLRRQDGGAWELDDIAIPDAIPFTDQNVAFAQLVAQRHGLTLDDDAEKPEITGPIHGTAIPELFRDPDMLALVAVKPLGLFLPAVHGRTGSGEISLTREDESRVPLTVPLAGFEPGPLVQPVGLAGIYAEHDQPGDRAFAVTVAAMPDGRFRITGGFGSSTLSLRPFDDAAGFYLATDVYEDNVGDRAEERSNILIAHRAESGWSFDRVGVRPATGTPALDALRRKAMEQAALRHGFSYDGDGWLSGKDMAALPALLHDAAFSTGLRVDPVSQRTLFTADRQPDTGK